MKRTTKDMILQVIERVHATAKEGPKWQQHEGWRELKAHKYDYRTYYPDEVRHLALRNDVEVQDDCTAGILSVIYTDKETDTEYCVTYQRPRYRGRPYLIVASITENASVANSN